MCENSACRCVYMCACQIPISSRVSKTSEIKLVGAICPVSGEVGPIKGSRVDRIGRQVGGEEL
jgi:hypothetical protein